MPQENSPGKRRGVPPEEDPAWDTFLSRHPEATFYQTRIWARIVGRAAPARSGDRIGAHADRFPSGPVRGVLGADAHDRKAQRRAPAREEGGADPLWRGSGEVETVYRFYRESFSRWGERPGFIYPEELYHAMVEIGGENVRTMSPSSRAGSSA